MKCYKPRTNLARRVPSLRPVLGRKNALSSYGVPAESQPEFIAKRGVQRVAKCSRRMSEAFVPA